LGHANASVPPSTTTAGKLPSTNSAPIHRARNGRPKKIKPDLDRHREVEHPLRGGEEQPPDGGVVAAGFEAPTRSG